MFEWWRRWTYPKWESRVAGSEKLADFERLTEGPWTPDMVRRMPAEVLLKGPTLGGINRATRHIIDTEIERRMQVPSARLGHAIGAAGVMVALAAIWATSD